MAKVPTSCEEGEAHCVRIVPTAESSLSDGATAVAQDDWSNNSTGKAGVTLTREIIFPPYLWVANHTQNTVSRVNTTTGREEGRYWVGMNPSRTAVDLDGNVWIGGRNDGRLTKILWDRTKCPDRNEDGSIQTASADELGPLNSAADPYADECVAYSKRPTPSQTSIRGIAAGPDGRVWFGFTGGGVQSIHPETLELSPHFPPASVPVYQRDQEGVYRPVVTTDGEPVTTDGGGVYGLVVDREGFLYASPINRGTLTRFNIFSKRWDAAFLDTRCTNYGIAIDGRDRVWMGCTDGRGGVMMFDPSARRTHRFGVPTGASLAGGTKVRVAYDDTGAQGGTGVTGLAAEPATGDIWASLYSRGVTARMNLNEGDLSLSTWTFIATSGGTDLRGVGFDHEGYAWTHGVGSDRIWRIDPRGNRLAPGYEEGLSVGGGTHYTYSDFTGSTGLSFTSPRGVWRFTVEAPEGSSPLQELRWQAFVPARTSAEIRLRPVAEGASWVPAPTEVGRAVYHPYETGAPLSTFELTDFELRGSRYEVEVRLSSTGQERPVVNAVELVWSLD
jgi:streptogramin lyase